MAHTEKKIVGEYPGKKSVKMKLVIVMEGRDGEITVHDEHMEISPGVHISEAVGAVMQGMGIVSEEDDYDGDRLISVQIFPIKDRS